MDLHYDQIGTRISYRPRVYKIDPSRRIVDPEGIDHVMTPDGLEVQLFAQHQRREERRRRRERKARKARRGERR
jgi:hypothetical protein